MQTAPPQKTRITATLKRTQAYDSIAIQPALVVDGRVFDHLIRTETTEGITRFLPILTAAHAAEAISQAGGNITEEYVDFDTSILQEPTPGPLFNGTRLSRRRP